MNTLNKIQQVVSDRIRPALQGHGGDMTITSFSNGILKFKFTGMCSNCPSAGITTEELVKNEILSNVPQFDKNDRFIINILNCALLSSVLLSLENKYSLYSNLCG